MKTKIVLLIIACTAIASCSKWHYGHGHHDDDGGGDNIIYEDIKVDEGIDSGKQKIFISPNEIIVRYDPDVLSEQRDEIRDGIVSAFSTFEFQECDCGDTNIELWTFDPDIEELVIEGVVQSLSRRSGTRGERSFDIQLASVGPFTPQGQVLADTVGIVGGVLTPSINIAVIDTGLDFQRYLHTETPKQFLFPSRSYSFCFDTGTGWNFTADNDGDGTREGDANFIDDNGHGTYITKIITDELDDKGVSYKILPLKVFDFSGRGSYWDVLCALAYIKDINEFNFNNIDIVNASFGGDMPREIFEEPTTGEPKNIFVEMLDDLNDKGVLVITSAGNDGEDNDIGPEGDFLSSFKSSNILSVGGYEYDTINPAARPIKLHPLSNFGSDGSIDIALAFNDYKIIFDTGDPFRKNRVTLQGTSYATAAMAGMAGTVINRFGSLSPEDLKNRIFDLSIEAPELEGKIAERRVIPRAE